MISLPFVGLATLPNYVSTNKRASNSQLTWILSSSDYLLVHWFPTCLWEDWKNICSNESILSLSMFPSGGNMWTISSAYGQEFLDVLNNLYTLMKFSIKVGGTQVGFLNLKISTQNQMFAFEETHHLRHHHLRILLMSLIVRIRCLKLFSHKFYCFPRAPSVQK